MMSELNDSKLSDSDGSESQSNTNFTLLFGNSDMPEYYHIPISHAKRALTLACLIPSGTHTFTLPISCRRDSVALCAQALALLSQTPLSFTYDMNASLPQYHTLTDGITASQLQEVGKIADALGITSFTMFCGEKLLHPTSAIRDANTGNNSQAAASSVEADAAAAVSRSRSDSHTPSTSLPEQIFIISDSGASYPLRGTLSELSPVLSQAVADGDDRVGLDQCDGDSVQLTIEFLELLTRVPLIVKSKSISPGQTLSDMVPDAYDDLLRDRVRLVDGSGSRVQKVCDALQLETLRLLLSLKIASLLTSFNPTSIVRQFNRPSITQSIQQ